MAWIAVRPLSLGTRPWKAALPVLDEEWSTPPYLGLRVPGGSYREVELGEIGG